MQPQRPPGSSVTAAVSRTSARAAAAIPSFDSVKHRIVSRLEERLDPATSKRMPSSLFRQSLLTAAENIAEHEARALPKADRERIVEAVLADFLGYGPLEELFRDMTVREVMVVGPQAVIVRREGEDWLPSNVKFRDDEHLRSAIERLATHADPIGDVTTSVNLYDLNLPNGFRAVALIPPDALGVAATVAFVRSASATFEPITQVDSAPQGVAATSPGAQPSSGSVKNATRPDAAAPAAGSGTVPSAKPHGAAEVRPPLAFYRKEIIEKLITKMARLGVYDVRRVEITELRRIVAAYIAEYCQKEHIYLSDTDQGRLLLEILTVMQR